MLYSSTCGDNPEVNHQKGYCWQDRNHSYATVHNWALLVFCRSKKEWEVTEYAQAMKPSQMPRFFGGVILVIDDSCSLSNFFLLQMIISRYSVSISNVFIESLIRIL